MLMHLLVQILLRDLTSLNTFSLLLFLFRPQVLCHQTFDFFALDGSQFFSNGRKSTCEHHSASGQDSHGALEVSNELPFLLAKHWELLHQLVFDALSHAYLRSNGVFEGSQAEGEGWESLVCLCEKLTRLLQLEVVLVLEFALVDSGSLLSQFGLAFTGRNVDVQMNDLAWDKSPVLNVLLGRLLSNDNLV